MNISLITDILKSHNQCVLDAPGVCNTFVEHPYLGERSCVPVDIVIEHRYAFSAWIRNKTRSQSGEKNKDEGFNPPDLLTFDWHNDIGGKCDFNERDLMRLNQKDENEIGLYCWAGLRSLNDGHIAPAIWLNAIGDVYAVIKQNIEDEKDRIFEDRYGKIHRVRYLKSPEDFVDSWTYHRNGLLWDIDLDYFTKSEEISDQRYTPMLSDRQIADLLDLSNEWVGIVLSELRGVTIALEPEYTGGLSNSLHLFKQWENAFFQTPLFNKNCCWKDIF
jgi:hypothetical protein